MNLHDEEPNSAKQDELGKGSSTRVTDENRHAPLVFVQGGKSRESKPWSSRMKIVVAVAIAAIASALVIPVAIGLSTPHPTALAAATNSPAPFTQPIRNTLPQSVQFDQTSPVLHPTLSIAAMDAMSIPEFAQQTYANRFAYLLHYEPNLQGVMIYQDSGIQHPNAIPGFYWFEMQTSSIGEANTTIGAKMASALLYYTSDEGGNIASNYQSLASEVEATGGAGVGPDNGEVFIASGDWQHGVDRDGNKIDFEDITYNEVTPTSKTEWTAQAIRCVIEIKGQDYVAYPQGSGVLGKAAPVAQYPY